MESDRIWLLHLTDADGAVFTTVTSYSFLSKHKVIIHKVLAFTIIIISQKNPDGFYTTRVFLILNFLKIILQLRSRPFRHYSVREMYR